MHRLIWELIESRIMGYHYLWEKRTFRNWNFPLASYKNKKDLSNTADNIYRTSLKTISLDHSRRDDFVKRSRLYLYPHPLWM